MEWIAKIRRYLELTTEEGIAKKQKEVISKELRAYVATLPDKTLSVEGFEVSLSDRGTVLDQEKMLKILKKIKRKDLIRKVEVPDMEKIEKLIYDQELSADLFAECTSPKQKDVISVKAVKKEESEDE